MSGLALQIDGFECLLATAGITSIPTSSDTDYPSDLTLLSAALEWPKVTITERCKPLDGIVDVSGINFRVHDITPSSGSASGHPVFTYLGTRRPSSVQTTVLSAACAAGDATINVASTTGFSSPSGTIWIDREAITYTGTTGTTFTGCSRGKYGSLDATHVYDSANSIASIVRAGFYSFEGRRCVLYLVDGSNVASVLWIGTIRNGPRLVDSDSPEGGAMFEFQCDSVSSVERELHIGANMVAVRPVGFDASLIATSLNYRTTAYLQSGVANYAPDRYCSSLSEALMIHERMLNDSFRTNSVNATAVLHEEGYGVALNIEVSGLPLDPAVTGPPVPAHAYLKVGAAEATDAYRDTADPRTMHAVIQNAPQMLTGVNGDVAATMKVDSIAGLPASWTATTRTDGAYITSVQNVLIGQLDSRMMAVVEPTSTSSNPTSITATGRTVDVGTGAETPGVSFTRDVPLRLGARVTTTHWLHGLRYGVIEANTITNTGLDSRNWEWSRINRAIELSGAAPAQRVWYLDGRHTAGELIADQCKFNGIGMGIKNGRQSPFALLPPLASDTPATITAGVLTKKSTFARNPDGIANTVEIESPGRTDIINDRLSKAEFGQGKGIKLTLPGSDDARVLSPDPMGMASIVLGRVLNLWSRPTHIRKFRLSLQYATDVWIGDYVNFTEWLTPDGAGGRGPSGAVGQIIGREINISPGREAGLTIEVLSYWQDEIYGYAPCCKVASIAGAVLTIGTNAFGASASPAGTSTIANAAGSNLATYSYGSDDYGVHAFVAGDKVKLVKRNVTTVTEETGLTILSVDPVAKTITLTSNPATVVGADWWDVVFDNYGNGASVTTNMGNYAWVGSYSTNVIGTSTTTAQLWAP